jgi:hypothetical protein
VLPKAPCGDENTECLQDRRLGKDSSTVWEILVPSSKPAGLPKSSERRRWVDGTEDLGAAPIFLQLILLGESQQQGRNLLNYINIIVTHKIQ